ncbi:hypothetical protein [Arthrobacter crystallopoietes]|uniref:hypothetical protein n=1 Tax=Crystallibacter crystallopoietes TaxID=37928 RepID=UPI0011113060|nr:hypothetical protein [Arthrobacter crystallopoietes]
MTAGIFSPLRVNHAENGWQKRSLRSLLVQRSERNRADLPLLTVARERGVFVRSTDDANHNAIPEDLSNYKVAREGDLVINKMKAWQGSLGLAPVDGIVSPAYFVFSADFAVPRFGEYLLRSRPYVAKFGAASDGVRIGQWDLNIPRMRNIEVNLPPAEQQAAIVKYLAHANARIDRAIAAKRRLVSLLEEQKASVAHERLTRGYEPNDLRGVGLPWADSIPQHWALAPVKRLFSSMVYGTSESSAGEGPVTAVGMGEIKNGNVAVVRRGGLANIPKGLELRQNDLLFNRTNSPDLVGKVGRMTGDCEDLTFASYLVRCRVAEKIDPEWAAYLLNDRAFLGFARSQAFVSLHQANLSSTRYGALPAVIPPCDEQRRIAEGLRKELAEFNGAVDRVNREITLLQEFRARLVADVVTGQVDVRAIVATLPDAPESIEHPIGGLDDDLEEALVGSEA